MKRKQGDELQQMAEQRSEYKHGDGLQWFRGAMIGKGSSGSVYLATSKKPRLRYGFLPSVMAVKSAEVSVSGSIQKEKEVLTNLKGCPCVIRCFGEEITTGEDGEMVYNLLLEYGGGGTLAGLIKKSGGNGLPESDVRRFTRSILLGLNSVHECGYVHCDMKPENILLVPCTAGGDAKFRAKIGDFGFAKRATQNKKRKLDTCLRGTPMYLSPEAVVDNEQEPPSDIWALGCIVLEMLTGKAPWDGERNTDAKGLLHQIAEGHKLPAIPSEISKEGKDFLKRCFVRKAMYRLTAEMLLNHPFVEGIVDEEEPEAEDIVNANDICTSLLFSETDDELSYCSSDGWSFISEEESSYYLLEDDIAEMDNDVVSSFVEEETLDVQARRNVGSSSHATGLDGLVETSVQVQSKKLQQIPVTFTIPTGV